MAAKVAVSALGKKLGAKLDTAVKAHRNDETKVGGRGKLPDFDNYIAQLVDMKIGYYEKGDNKGEPFFYAAGAIQFPKKVNVNKTTVVDVEGLRTQFGPEPLCDTKNSKGEVVTLDMHVANVLNLFRLLGVDTSDVGGDDIEPTIEVLKSQAPYFQVSVSTSAATTQYPNPKTWENWGKACEYTPDGDTGVVDGTGEELGGESTEEEVQEQSSDVPFGDDIDDLVGTANGEDEDAAADAHAKLTELAKAAGKTQKDIDNSKSWEQVGEWCREGQNEGEADDAVDYDALGAAADGGDQESADKLDELRQAADVSDDDFNSMSWIELAAHLSTLEEPAAEEETSTTPEVGQVWKYKPIELNPKTKKMEKSKVAKEHEVLSVVGEKVTLKNLDTNKTLLNPATKKPLLIPFEELEE
jgi:hypothetical protein